MENTNSLLLDDVLTGFRREEPGPAPAAVAAWCKRFPRFADEIAEDAMLWAEENLNASLHRETARDDSLYAAVGSAALNALYRSPSTPAPGREAVTLGDALDASGLSIPEAARQMSLPRSVVSKLIRGDIMGASIPGTLTEMLARLLRRSFEWTQARYPATVVQAFAEGVTGRRTATLTFQDAIADAHDAEDAQRTFWLEEA